MKIESNTSYTPNMRLMYPAQGALLSVFDHDPVYSIQEGYAMNQAGTGYHRYQVILLPVADRIYSFWTDLGPAENFKLVVDGTEYRTPPYQQIVLLEHDVAECMFMAEHGRNDDFAIKLLNEQTQASTLFEDYARLIEEDMYLVKNRSTFGYGGSIQRNGFSAEGARTQRERNGNGI